MYSDLTGQNGPPATVAIDLQGHLEKLASGKVRDLFEVDKERLLFIASDRISAFDVVMKNVSSNPLPLEYSLWTVQISSVEIVSNMPGVTVTGSLLRRF